MTLILPTDARISWWFTTPGPYPAACTLGLRGVAEPDDVLDALVQYWNDEIRPVSPASYTLDRIELKMGPEETGPTYISAVGTAGPSSAAALPPSACLLVRKQVLGSGRLAGRMYWPGLFESNVDNAGTITDSGLSTAVEGLYELLQNVLNVQPTVFPTGPFDPRQITGLQADGRIATQRRRLRR